MPEFSAGSRRPNLLIISNDIVDNKMAGPGIRYVEMARALSDAVDITLAVPGETNLQIPGIRIVTYQDNRPELLEVLVQNHEQSLISGYMVFKFPFLRTTRTRLIVDMYDPFFLENYYYYQDLPIEEQVTHNSMAISVVNELAQLGDFFICGNERQRDLWLGVLSANRRVNPRTIHDDETLRSLIDVVGVGIPDRPLEARPFLKDGRPEFPPESKIVLWGGGIWNWLDPLTLVRSWKKVIQARPEARLVFLGTRHPNPAVPRHEIVDRLIALAEETGEKDRTIFFIEWLTFQDREALLAESHVGVTLHPIHAETRYSIRTRVLDYLWARLPICITEGDVTSEWAETYHVGRAVPEGNADALSDALITLLATDKTAFQPGFDQLQATLSWTQVVQPLKRFALHGANAADRGFFHRSMRANPSTQDLGLDGEIRGTFRRAAYLWATKGTAAMVSQTITHIKFILRKR